jgi:hypothetical protein
MYNLPFPSDRPLFETIQSKYLFNVLKWLGDFQDPTSSTFLGAKTGSTWGVAYSLICLLHSREIYLQTNVFPSDFDTRARHSVEYLLDKTTLGKDTCHWDGNIWDTAVITRALISYKEAQPNNDHLIDIIKKALKWLSMQVIDWDELRYTLGLTDIAQIFRTFIIAMENLPSLLEEISVELGNPEKRDHVINVLVDEILHSVKPMEIIVDDKPENVITWEEDVFTTAEIIISLSRFITTESVKSNLRTKHEILDLMGQALRFLELKQIDGRWGIEEETAVALRSYLVGHDSWDKPLQPEPHIVFKALRYFCDEKTVFPDGSIAHEMEPTIYYCLALIDTLSKWKLPDELCTKKPVIELYDYILWNTPTRSTYERLLRSKAEAEAGTLRATNKDLNSDVSKLSKQLNLWKSTLYAVGWVAFLIILISISGSVSTSPISIPAGFRIADWDVFLALTAAWATLGLFLYRILILKRGLQ